MSGVAPKRALILIRESNEKLRGGFSPDTMIAKCRAKVEELGAELIEPPIVEVGKRDEWDIPGLLRAVRLAEQRAYDYLVSFDTSRMAGDLGKLLWLKKNTRQHGVEIHYAQHVFAEGAEGDLHETMLGAFDGYEKAKIRLRTQNGVAGKLEKKLPIGAGKAAFGSRKVRDDRQRPIGYAPDSDEFSVLAHIVKAAQTQTLGKIARDLTAAGIPTPGGATLWRPSTVRKLLHNDFYLGQYDWGRRKQEPRRREDGERWWKSVKNDPAHVTTIEIPALIDPSELAAARAAISRRKTERRARMAEADDPFTLRGRLRCGHCRGVLATSGAGTRRYYMCLRAYRDTDRTRPRDERCPLPMLPAAPIERHAWARLVERVTDRETFERELQLLADGGEALARYRARLGELQAEVGRLERRLANGARQLRDFDPDGPTYATMLAGQQADERARRLLVESLTQLERQKPEVIGPAEIEQARVAWQRLERGVAVAGEASWAQRQVYAALKVRAAVTNVAIGGEQLGKHRWTVAWLTADGSEELPGEGGRQEGDSNGVPHLQECGTLLILTPDRLTLARRRDPARVRASLDTTRAGTRSG